MRGSGTVWLIANRPLIPTRPVFSVESTGPNMSGPLTVTITGFTQREELIELSQGCDWSNINLVCQFSHVWPQTGSRKCLYEVPGPGSGYVNCHSVVLGFPANGAERLPSRRAEPSLTPTRPTTPFGTPSAAPRHPTSRRRREEHRSCRGSGLAIVRRLARHTLGAGQRANSFSRPGTRAAGGGNAANGPAGVTGQVAAVVGNRAGPAARGRRGRLDCAAPCQRDTGPAKTRGG